MAMCSVMIDVGTIEAGSFAAAEDAARRLVEARYPRGQIRIVTTSLPGSPIIDADIQAALAVREERKAP